MDDLPKLTIRAPDGSETTIQLRKERVTIGRQREINDIVLDDPCRIVSGHWHCIVEAAGTAWRVVDNESTNGTYLRRDGEPDPVRGSRRLLNGDVICLLASRPELGEQAYWELTFLNPTTVPVASAGSSPRLEYDWAAHRLFRVTDGGTQEIVGMRPQVHKLLRCMLARNRDNHDAPVLCSPDDLIDAVWDGAVNHSREELNRLVMELRRSIEIDPKNARFLQRLNGIGIRLDVNPGAS